MDTEDERDRGLVFDGERGGASPPTRFPSGVACRLRGGERRAHPIGMAPTHGRLHCVPSHARHEGGREPARSHGGSDARLSADSLMALSEQHTL